MPPLKATNARANRDPAVPAKRPRDSIERRTGSVIVLQEQPAPFEHPDLIRGPGSHAASQACSATLARPVSQCGEGSVAVLGDGNPWIDRIGTAPDLMALR